MSEIALHNGNEKLWRVDTACNVSVPFQGQLEGQSAVWYNVAVVAKFSPQETSLSGLSSHERAEREAGRLAESPKTPGGSCERKF